MKKAVKRMLDTIEDEVHYTRSLIGKDALDPRVMTAMGKVPREQFVPPNLRPLAYDNGPLPIGHGQTISQPYIVALMTDLLQLQPEHAVLEVGTGSGYQTAVLAQLARKVYTIELVSELGEDSAERLRALDYTNIEYRIGNGYAGWPEHAPYDGIIVTAAAAHIPPALVEQLRPGGRLVIPVGLPYMHQELMLVEKDAGGGTHTRDILGVAFVPLRQEQDRRADTSTLH
ncbi:MAG: protein-L-isoaspartate(D-aspartate) O-methyltransferase [Gammaproteobacteria bacterium]|nr:protein-L-isoaspartate(D-aspartate) O-methyltransferase [Gammaproteobacteria bacterium]